MDRLGKGQSLITCMLDGAASDASGNGIRIIIFRRRKLARLDSKLGVNVAKFLKGSSTLGDLGGLRLLERRERL